MNFRSTLSLVFLGCLFGVIEPACFAQAIHKARGVAPDKVALLLIRDAELLPPEFAADITLQVIENATSLSAYQQRRSLKNAFDKAALDQDDVARRPWGTSVEETSEGLHAIASSIGRLDRVSEQSRVVQKIAKIDPARAKAELEMIALPRFDPPPCRANWFYLPDAYYEAVATVTLGDFSPKEISSGQRGEVLTSVVSRVVSHSQLPPVTRLIRVSGLSSAELANLVSPYIYALDSLRGDSHSFYATNQQSVDEFVALIARLDEQGVGVFPVITSFRKYLVANFKAVPCSPFKDQASGRLPLGVQEFNNKLLDRLKAAGLTTITHDEIENEARDASPTESEPPRWDSNEMSDLTLSLQKLPDMSKENGSLETKYREYLLRLNGWSNQTDTETAFFHHKAMLYFGVIERLSPSALRTGVLMDFVKFLEQNSYQQVSKVDWFFYARRLLDLGDKPADRSDVIDALNRSSDPVLNLYGRLESWKIMRTPSHPVSSSSTSPTN